VGGAALVGEEVFLLARVAGEVVELRQRQLDVLPALA
jgi:hypothetical protein